MPEHHRFQAFKPKVTSRIRLERTCRLCGERRPIDEMEYDGPILDMSRDPANFICKFHAEGLSEDPLKP